MEWTDAVTTLADGRKLGHVSYGSPDGLPVFHFHGALTSRWEGFWLHRAARACGVRLVTVDRPGIGVSDFVVGRRIADWPRDVAQLADRLGFGPFAVIGVSGGGPYALACAAAMPERVKRVALVAAAAPLHDRSVVALMSTRQQWILRPMIDKLPMLRSVIFGLKCMPPLLRVLALGAVLGGLSPADLKLVRGEELRREMKLLPLESFSAPFGTSVQGPAWDGHLHGHPWGFDLSSITSPVDLWYAEDDRIIPAAMGRWLAERLPGARANYFADDGHLSLIIGRAPEYIGPLAAALRAL
jgi:pimeloyl-ACP methyl ester carboxylesterase